MHELRQFSAARLGSLFRTLVLASFVLLLRGVLAEATEEPVYTSYETFLHLSAAELATVQVKLTYMGPAYGIAPAVILYAAGSTPNAGAFAPFYRPASLGLHYEGDENPYYAAISTSEIASLLSGIGGLPAVVDGDVAQVRYVDFSILVSLPTPRVFDSVLSEGETLPLFDRLRTALAGNSAAYRIVERMACETAMLETERPEDVSSSATVHFGGVRRDADSDRFLCTATITNMSTNSSLASPLSLVLVGLIGSTKLSNASGTTCGTKPTGQYFITVPTQSGGLAPGQSVDVRLEFENSNLNPIAPSAKVLAGPGAR